MIEQLSNKELVNNLLSDVVGEVLILKEQRKRHVRSLSCRVLYRLMEMFTPPEKEDMLPPLVYARLAIEQDSTTKALYRELLRRLKERRCNTYE